MAKKTDARSVQAKKQTTVFKVNPTANVKTKSSNSKAANLLNGNGFTSYSGGNGKAATKKDIAKSSVATGLIKALNKANTAAEEFIGAGADTAETAKKLLAQSAKEHLALTGPVVKEAASYIAQGKVPTGSDLINSAKKVATKSANDVVSSAKQAYNTVKDGFVTSGKKVLNVLKTIFNHPEWYGKYPQLITSNLNWGIKRGSNTLFDTAIGATIKVNFTLPLKDGQTSQSFIDAINMIYAKVRGSNSGAFNYDPADISYYIIATASVRALHAKLSRDIKLINSVNPYEEKTPDSYLTVAGYNAAAIEDMKKNSIAYITQLNQIAAAMDASFPIPPAMSIYDRWKFIASAAFADSQSAKRSVYMYTIGINYHMGADQTVGLTTETLGTTFGSQIEELQSAINAMSAYTNTNYGGATFMRIAGDLLKAYGASALCTTPVISINDKVDFIFDEYSLHQIQNAAVFRGVRVYGTYPTFTQGTATVNNNLSYAVKIKEIPGVVNPTSSVAADIPVNMGKDSVTGLEAISLTRLNGWVAHTADTLSTGANSLTGYLQGTEYVFQINIHYYPQETTGVIQTLSYDLGSVLDANTANFTKLMQLAAQLDYFPRIEGFDNVANPVSKIFMDIDNYAMMSRDQFRQFNEAAILSLFKTVDIQNQVNFKAVKR